MGTTKIEEKGGERVKDNKKMKAAKVAAVTVAAAGVVTGTLFDSPADLVSDMGEDAVVEETLDDSGTPQEKKRGPADRLRIWILELPAAVRMLVGVPLWAVGWVLMTGVSALVGTAAAPLERLVSWLCLSAVLLTVFAFSVKSSFPEVPVRQILRGRNVVFISIMALILGMADLALPTVWAGYDARTQLVWRIGATCLLVFVCGMALMRHGRKASSKQRELTQEEIRAEALRLADSVTPGNYEI